MKKQLSIELSDEFVSGDQISLADWNEWNIALSEHGFVHVYLGSLLENNQLFAVSAAARHGIERNRVRLVSVDRGSLSLRSFFQGQLSHLRQSLQTQEDSRWSLSLIAYEMKGTAPPLLFIHGALVSRAMWRPQIEYFSEQYRVIAPDLPAHGATPDIGPEYTIANLSEWVVQLLDRLRVEQCHVCGHSLGGMVAQQLAISHPTRIKRLVLAETAFGTYDSLWERLQTSIAIPFLKIIPPRILVGLAARRYGTINHHVGEFVRQEMGRYDQNRVLRVMSAAFDFAGKQQLPRILSPTLVLVAEKNRQTHRHGKQMADLIPNASFTIIPNSHHLLNLDNPETFNRVVLAFLGVSYD